MASSTQTEQERVSKLLRDFAASLAAAGPNEDDLVYAAVVSCKDLLQARQCSVWLVDSHGRNLVLRAATGYKTLTDDKTGQLCYPLNASQDDCGITARIFLRQEPESADSFQELKQIPGHKGNFDGDLHGLLRREDVDDLEHPCQQFYGGPISLVQDRFGVLKVENKMVSDADGILRFSDSDKSALDTVAAMLALALMHARAAREAQNQLQKYHAFTVHSIRNELMPIETASDLLRQSLERDELKFDDLRAVERFQKLGTQGLDFYLTHLLKFLRAEIDRQGMAPVRLDQILKNEVWLLGEVSSGLLDANLVPGLGAAGELLVRADSEFLAATIKELLRNSRKAVFRRREKEEIAGVVPTLGCVEVKYTVHEVPVHKGARHVCISVSDNGDATIDERARDELEKLWSQSGHPRLNESGQKGLEFARWVIGEHGGQFELETVKDMTVFTVRLPVA